jgi:DNA helicase-2/ATP-dependent DNA helicase PcrA
VDRSDPAAGLPAMPRRYPEPRPAPGHAPAAAGFKLVTAAELAGASCVPGAEDLALLGPGASVVHPQYGIGRIVAVDGLGPGRKGRVAFAVGPERTFVLAKSPLRPVGGNRGKIM